MIWNKIETDKIIKFDLNVNLCYKLKLIIPANREEYKVVNKSKNEPILMSHPEGL